MSVRECQARVSSREFGEWLAYWQLEAAEVETPAPDDDELAAKMTAWAARTNAAQKR